MPIADEEALATVLAVRPILEQVANKWAILILTYICEKPQRFNVIKRRLNGVTQKALTETLRRLERNGLVARRVFPVSPVAVEYSLTPLGRTLRTPLTALFEWTVNHQLDISKAQRNFDLIQADMTPPE